MSRTVSDPQPRLFFVWLIIGMSSLIGVISWLIVQPDVLTRPVLDPIVVSWTHLLMLGWLSTLFFAAGYQLIPVMTLNPIFSKNLSRVHLGLHGLGVPLMVYAFARTNDLLLGAGGSLVYLGFILFAINALLSAGFRSRWSPASLLWFMGVFWMLVGVTLAMVMVGIRLGWMTGWASLQVLGLHVHVMLFGFFLLLLIAASSKLLPMFLLSPEKPQLGTWLSGALVSLVLFVGVVTVGLESEGLKISLLSGALIALFAYYGQVIYFVGARRRRVDEGILLFVVCLLFLMPVWQALRQYHLGDGDFESMRRGILFLTLVVFNGCILGMAQKIVPFMLWHSIYSRYLGKYQLPQTQDLLNRKTLWPITSGWILSAILAIPALYGEDERLIRTMAVLMLVPVLFFISNVPHIIRHWKLPQLKPFPGK